MTAIVTIHSRKLDALEDLIEAANRNGAGCLLVKACQPDYRKAPFHWRQKIIPREHFQMEPEDDTRWADSPC